MIAQLSLLKTRSPNHPQKRDRPPTTKTRSPNPPTPKYDRQITPLKNAIAPTIPSPKHDAQPLTKTRSPIHPLKKRDPKITPPKKRDRLATPKRDRTSSEKAIAVTRQLDKTQL